MPRFMGEGRGCFDTGACALVYPPDLGAASLKHALPPCFGRVALDGLRSDMIDTCRNDTRRRRRQTACILLFRRRQGKHPCGGVESCTFERWLSYILASFESIESATVDIKANHLCSRPRAVPAAGLAAPVADGEAASSSSSRTSSLNSASSGWTSAWCWDARLKASRRIFLPVVSSSSCAYAHAWPFP